jgi:acetoin utilization deacetylase AcuC-like enzyme
MAVTERGFARITRMLMDMAKAECDGKLLFVLEGGYDIPALTNSVKAVISELKDASAFTEGVWDTHPSEGAVWTVSKAKQAIMPYWGEF